jgi:hypothetical protein
LLEYCSIAVYAVGAFLQRIIAIVIVAAVVVGFDPPT